MGSRHGISGWSSGGVASSQTPVDTSGYPQIIGTNGADHLQGGPGNDVIWAGYGSDYIIGGPGNDIIHVQGLPQEQGHAPPYPYFNDGADVVLETFSGRNAGLGHDQIWEFTPADELQLHDRSGAHIHSASQLDKFVTVTSTGSTVDIEWKNGSGGIEIHLNGSPQNMQDWTNIHSLQSFSQFFHLDFL